MKKSLPMSALITGLLAAPMLGIAPPVLGKETQQSPIVRAQTFPAEMPGAVAEQMRRIARGEKPSAFGMQDLQRRLTLQMQQRLAVLLGKSRRQEWEVQLLEPATAPMIRIESQPAQTQKTQAEAGPVPAGMSGVSPDLQNDVKSITTHAVRSSINVQADGAVTRQTVDDQHDITLLRAADGKEQLTVKDASGRVLFDGAPGTPEELAKAELAAEVLKKIQDLRQSPSRVQVGNGAAVAAAVGDAGVVEGGGAGLTVRKSVVMNQKDDQHDITLRSDNGVRHLTVKELASGKTVFDGPANADDDLKSLPAGVAEKVKALLAKVK